MEKKLDKQTLKKRYEDIIPLFKEEKTQNFTTTVLTLIAFVIFGLFAINPTITTIAQLRKQLSDSQFVYDKLQEKINNLKTLQVQYAQMTDDLGLVLKAIPESPTIPLVTGQVHALVVKNNLELIRLQVLQIELSASNASNSAVLKQNGSFVFLLDAKGTTVDTARFLSSLINTQRIITIDTLSATRDSEKTGLMTISLRARAYFQ